MTHSPGLIDLFNFSYANICSKEVVFPLVNSDHIIVSISFDFPSSSKGGCPFSLQSLMTILVLIGMVFFMIMRDVPWKNIFKLGAIAAATEFTSVPTNQIFYI